MHAPNTSKNRRPTDTPKPPGMRPALLRVSDAAKLHIERRQVAHESSSERHWKFCTAQIAPSTSAKPQATLVYAVLLMLM